MGSAHPPSPRAKQSKETTLKPLDQGEEILKVVSSVAAKRPRMDLLPDMRTQVDLIREDVQHTRAKIDETGAIMTTAAGTEERSQLAAILSSSKDALKGLPAELKATTADTKRMIANDCWDVWGKRLSTSI